MLSPFDSPIENYYIQTHDNSILSLSFFKALFKFVFTERVDIKSPFHFNLISYPWLMSDIKLPTNVWCVIIRLLLLLRTPPTPLALLHKGEKSSF